MQYVIPGFLWLKFFCYATKRKTNDFALVLMWSVAISTVLLWLCRGNLVYTAIVGIITLIVACWFLKTKICGKILSVINHRSPTEDIWDLIHDCEKGTIARVYLKYDGISYAGELVYREEEGRHSMLVLSNYRKYQNGVEIERSPNEKISVVAVYLENVSRIELFYEDDTKLFED